MKVTPITRGALALLLLGCGGTSGIQGDAQPEWMQDARVDVATDTMADVPLDTAADPLLDTALDPEPDLPGGPGITFRISFVTDIPGYEFLYVQTSDEMSHQLWAGILDGGVGVPLQPRCDICPCDVCSGCPVCGIGMPVVLRVGTGENAEWYWNGTTYPTGDCTEGPGGPTLTCQEYGLLDPGSYSAAFCFAVAGPDAFEDGWIHDPVCVDLEFTYPVPGGVIHHVVDNGG